MNSELNIRLGRKIFGGSFLLGTFIFIANILTNNSSLLIVGYIFLTLAILLNIGILITIIINTITDNLNRKALLKTGGLIILNIPVALTYIAITMALMNVMIVTIENTYETAISSIRIEGCESIAFDRLEPKEKHTVWIDIKTDCQINVSYNQNNERRTENVIGYVSAGMGKRIKYEIGKVDKE